MSQMHTLNYKIEKIPSGYIAQCVEIPQIIAQAKTKPTLDKKIGVIIDGYLKACPDAFQNLQKTVGYAEYEIQKNA